MHSRRRREAHRKRRAFLARNLIRFPHLSQRGRLTAVLTEKDPALKVHKSIADIPHANLRNSARWEPESRTVVPREFAQFQSSSTGQAPCSVAKGRRFVVARLVRYTFEWADLWKTRRERKPGTSALRWRRDGVFTASMHEKRPTGREPGRHTSPVALDRPGRRTVLKVGHHSRKEGRRALRMAGAMPADDMRRWNSFQNAFRECSWPSHAMRRPRCISSAR